MVDSAFTNMYMPRGDQFTGGDGVYSAKLPDGRTVWIFGDTFLGNVTPDNRRIKTDPLYIRNSFVIPEEGQLTTFHQGEPHEYKSMMIPPEVADGSSGFSELDLWYWPGDAFIEEGNLNVFVSKFYQKEKDMWGFRFVETELFEFSLPDFQQLRVNDFGDLDSIHFGHAVCPTETFTYIYGLKNQFPYVARAPKGKVRGKWEFYNGSSWVSDAKKAVPMVKFSGSEQFSVFQWDETFIMIMQEGGLGRKIYSFIAKTPYGPWTNQQMIYKTPLLDNCKDCWTYNALAHPQFTEEDMLLISYNTNSMVLQDHYDNALIYRPRFIRVPIENIIE
ncbi:DUF5005 domain-containing protein [Fulvivirga sp. M361]|nr:DUF5005 domain-containing protein [Fulvivirga sp. M361]